MDTSLRRLRRLLRHVRSREGRRTLAVVLVGRDAELSALDVRVRAACAGAGQVVVLEGEPGIGKSALLAACVVTAKELGATTLIARCDELGGARPFGPILDAFGDRK